MCVGGGGGGGGAFSEPFTCIGIPYMPFAHSYLNVCRLFQSMATSMTSKQLCDMFSL